MINQNYTRPQPQPTTPGPRRPIISRGDRQHQAAFLARFEAAFTDAFMEAFAAADQQRHDHLHH